MAQFGGNARRDNSTNISTEVEKKHTVNRSWGESRAFKQQSFPKPRGDDCYLKVKGCVGTSKQIIKPANASGLTDSVEAEAMRVAANLKNKFLGRVVYFILLDFIC